MPARLARFAVLVIAACAGPTSSAPQQPTPRADLVCISEPQTGTHLVETRCYKRSELDERREADRAILDKAQMNANRPAGKREQ
jgi:hypothetical protein